jgi:hypothetical protein
MTFCDKISSYFINLIYSTITKVFAVEFNYLTVATKSDKMRILGSRYDGGAEELYAQKKIRVHTPEPECCKL